MIRRPLRVIVLLVTLGAATTSAAALFMMKKDAERDAEAIAELGRRIDAERQRISELTAEWSLLNHPSRLQLLVDRHNNVLNLAPIAAQQIVTVEEAASAARRNALEEEQ